MGTDQESAGAAQWKPKNGAAANAVPDAHDPKKRHAPIMFTTDLSLRVDPAYEKISRRFLAHPDEFADAFARAWFKLTHRDMGPLSRYLGPLVPKETLLWQDPVPAVNHPLIDAKDITALSAKILASGLTIPELVSTAWGLRPPFAVATSAAEPTAGAFAWRRRRIGKSINRPNWPRSSVSSSLSRRSSTRLNPAARKSRSPI